MLRLSRFLPALLTLVGISSVSMTQTTSAAEVAKDKTIHSISVNTIEGKPVELGQYEGKVLLIVNVASRCGLTPQYTALQSVYDKYKEKGLVVMGFPCNQFGKQEPGSNKEIQEFCSSKYKVTFDMFDKVDVNGPTASPLYKALTSADAKPKGPGDVGWNFEKFLIGKNGEILARFDSRTAPDDKKIIEAIEKALQ
jgi:glutathione peroxidase